LQLPWEQEEEKRVGLAVEQGWRKREVQLVSRKRRQVLMHRKRESQRRQRRSEEQMAMEMETDSGRGYRREEAEEDSLPR